MTAHASTRIVIVGAGLGGALMACYLARAGYKVDIYERRRDPRVHGFEGGRSINLALSERGLHALREVELEREVLRHVIPMPGRMIHSINGSLHFQPYSKNPEDRINSISRATLNLQLLNAAASFPHVSFMFDHRCVAIDFATTSITFERGHPPQRANVHADLIIGADGAFSSVRLQMMLNMDRFEYQQTYLEHGYKELTIPPAERCGVDPGQYGGFAMNPNALHIWPRGGFMMIALPNVDKTFTCTCFWPFTGPNGFDALQSDDDIRGYFAEQFPDAARLMPTLVDDYRRNPTASLVTVRCCPWQFDDKAVLIGDAAHAIVPFFGQGMNCAFEDCSVLNQCLAEFAPDWGTALATFSTLRKPNADAIASMALDNFVEMRDKTASPVFRMRKKFEHGLHWLFPQWFTPLYNMISFSNIPYAQAKARARVQNRLLAVLTVCLAALVLFLLMAMFSD